MKLEDWSILLYYPLGLLPSLFFFLRFFIQWMRSEKQKRSVVDRTFWQLSLYGNVLLALHYFIQLQLIFLMIQVINMGISWRNLSLMSEEKKRLSVRSMSYFLLMLVGICWIFFFYQWMVFDHLELWSVPLGMRQESNIPVRMEWKMIGMIGSFLFACRFWVQWWESEKKGKSELGMAFWVLSLVGSICLLIYCFLIQDRVSLVHYVFGLIPYMRNLLLIFSFQLKGKYTRSS